MNIYKAVDARADEILDEIVAPMTGCAWIAADNFESNLNDYTLGDLDQNEAIVRAIAERYGVDSAHFAAAWDEPIIMLALITFKGDDPALHRESSHSPGEPQ